MSRVIYSIPFEREFNVKYKFPIKFYLKIICYWPIAEFVTRPLTFSDIWWPPVTFKVKVYDHILFQGLISVCIPKMVKEEGRGTPENGDMKVFSIRI